MGIWVVVAELEVVLGSSLGSSFPGCSGCVIVRVSLLRPASNFCSAPSALSPLSWSQSGEEAPLHWERGPRRGEPHLDSGLSQPPGLGPSMALGQDEDMRDGQGER